MTDEQNERAARVWREACAACEDGAAAVIDLPMRDMVIAGDQAATAVIAREFEALEAENAALKAIQADEGEMLTIAWMDGAHRARQNHRERITALEAEVKRLRELVEAGRLAIGDHFAPNDCYATGPLTGNSYRDLVVCPACSFLTDYDAMKARAALGAEP